MFPKHYRIVNGRSAWSGFSGYRIERRFWLLGWVQVDWWPNLEDANNMMDCLLGRHDGGGEVIREEVA
jgi:hypothetical protein